jgi:hypothetical protein
VAVGISSLEGSPASAEAVGAWGPQVPRETGVEGVSIATERGFEGGGEVGKELGPAATAGGDCDGMAGAAGCGVFDAPAHRLAGKRSRGQFVPSGSGAAPEDRLKSKDGVRGVSPFGKSPLKMGRGRGSVVPPGRLGG